MSVDGRVTLRRGHLLLEKDDAQAWQSTRTPSAAALESARQSQLTSLYHSRVVLEGSGSLVTDSAGPLTGLPTEFDGPTDLLYDDFLPAEVLEREDHENWFTVVDSRGRVHWDNKGGSGGWDVLVLVARATPAPYLAYLQRERVSYLLVGDERVDLALALRRLQDHFGVTCVVSKAGGGLNGALLRAGLVDEIHLLVDPTAVGGLGTPTLFDGPPLAEGERPTPLRLLSCHVESDGMLWLRYEVVRDSISRVRAYAT
jgi:riboflavin biosynthesis pyrimidine reductase